MQATPGPRSAAGHLPRHRAVLWRQVYRQVSARSAGRM